MWMAAFTALLLVAKHAHFWGLMELADGGHVAADFLEQGVSLDVRTRMAGFVIAGIPVAFFALALKHLAQAFRVAGTPATPGGGLDRHLVSTGRYAFIGSLTLTVYPTVLSLTYLAMRSMDRPAVILSVEPHVLMLLVVTALFYLLARVIGPRLAEDMS